MRMITPVSQKSNSAGSASFTYDIADSSAVVYCHLFFSAKRRERLGRGTGGITGGTTFRAGGGVCALDGCP